MHLKKIAFVFLIYSGILFAQNDSADRSELQTSGAIKGIVRDSVTTEILPYASVFIPELNRGAYTDKRGYFVIQLLPVKRKYKITVSFVGYSAYSREVYIKEDGITNVEVLLKPVNIEMKTVVSTEKRELPYEKLNISQKSILINDITSLPKGVEADVFRTLQLQPGVQSAGDVSARYYVRGSPNDENLILYNDAPIYNPFHALGIFSVIDPETVNSIDFYKGGFGAQYGDRMSSVLNIISKDGNQNNYGASASLSQLTAKALVQGPIPYGSFIISGRASYSDAILKKFLNNQVVPIDFYDMSFKLNYSNPDFAPTSKFTIYGFNSYDNIDYNNLLQPTYNWSNSIIGGNWFHTGDSPLFSEVTFYYCRFYGEQSPNQSDARFMKNEIKDITAKVDIHYIYENNNELYCGLKITDIYTDLFLKDIQGDQNDLSSRGSNITIYTGYKLQSEEHFKADFGTRLNLSGLSQSGSLLFEPRINLKLIINPVLSFKAAWGMYKQELVTVSDENEINTIFEPWIIVPGYLNPPNSIHYIGGLDLYLNENTSIDAEGYYKVMNNLPSINHQKYFATDPDLVGGSGESYGSELSFNYNKGPMNLMLSYAYSWTTKTVNGLEYHPRYDSRNSIKADVMIDLGGGWSTSAMWIYNSGTPYTQIDGYYDKLKLNNLYDPNEFFLDHYPNQIFGVLYAQRLPDYHRLDLNLSKKIKIGYLKLSVDLNVINVYNRKNFFYFDTNTGERVNMLPFLPTLNVKVEL